MTDQPKRIPDEQLERYLDNQLSEEDAAQMESRLADDKEANYIAELQQEIDAELRNRFSPPNVSVASILSLIDDRTTNPTNRRGRQRVIVAATALLTITLSIAIGVWIMGDAKVEPFFQQRRLTSIYAETVDQGFKPYYFCEDPERFAMTFAKRQHTPLRLETLPPDRRMVGLSYPGGLSRDTTAILCFADDTPVVVFVDRREFENKTIAIPEPERSMNVHRKELGELVLYEVSPLLEPRFLDFLRIELPSNRRNP